MKKSKTKTKEKSKYCPSNLFCHEKSPDIGLLLARLTIGLTMALTHGWGKIPPSDGLVAGVTGMGFPLPGFFAWAASLSEFAGGILIAVGLCTRPAAFFMAFTMGVAFFVVHSADPFQTKELAFLYMNFAVLFMFTGAGRYSLDKKFCCK